MITAVDTSVLLDVFGADSRFGEASRESLRRCLREGGLVACDVVWAELVASFPAPAAATQAMERLTVAYSPLDANAAVAAGEAWQSYRRAGGKRSRVIPDFLIGGHASVHAERLLTRDRGFYRSHFKQVSVLDPSAG